MNMWEEAPIVDEPGAVRIKKTNPLSDVKDTTRVSPAVQAARDQDALQILNQERASAASQADRAAADRHISRVSKTAANTPTATPAWASAPEFVEPPKAEAPKPEPAKIKTFADYAGDVVAGAARGAGSIGATILTPFDALARSVGVENAYIGRSDRREAMDGALTELGADTNSAAFGLGKVGAEIAGTSGAGGLIGKGLSMVPGLAKLAPSVIAAVESGGMSAGGAAGLAGLAARTAGGAATGAAAAGMVDPSSAGTGAIAGAVLPGALQVAGKAGQVVGRAVGGPKQSPDLVQAVQAARGAGYVIPPTQAKPTMLNRVLEGFSGKITTAQNASAKNAGVSNRLAAEALGLPGDTKLTVDVLKSVRDQAGQAYAAIGRSGVVQPGPGYSAALDNIAAPYLQAAGGFPNAAPSPVLKMVDSLRSTAFDSSSAVAMVKQLRTAADDAFRTGNTDIARASKAAATAIEDALDAHLAQSGNQAALQAFRDARQLIAKTYTVEKALNGTTGTVDARKLATQLARGKPLSGELKQAAEFAARFPKAAQPVEAMGSLPQVSALDSALSLAAAFAASDLRGLAGVFARPAVRGLTLSPVVQNHLVSGQNPSAIARLFMNPRTEALVYRSAPVLAANQRHRRIDVPD